MLDKDLAVLYDVTTFNLNKAVKRNLKRFPNDFMFQLNKQENQSLIFQSGISKKGRGGRRFLPYVFTEQGVAMLSTVLNSNRAIQVNILIMRAFVKFRKILSEYADLRKRIEAIERKYDSQLKTVFEAIKQLLNPPPEPPKKQIGFAPNQN